MKSLKLVACMSAVALLASACAIGPGSKQSETPPQIVVKDNAKTWDDPSLFGPVPSQLATKGAQTCASLNTDKAQYAATGYHAKAKNIDGKPFADGGYFCQPK